MIRSAASLRCVLLAALAIVLGLVVAGCGHSAPARVAHAPSTGATPRTGLMAQWKYKSITTPEKKTVDLSSTNAWVLLNDGGRAQGLATLPWQGTYQLGEGWIAFHPTQRASLPLPKNASQAIELASTVTSKLLSGKRITFTRPADNSLSLSVDGYVLTLVVWG